MLKLLSVPIKQITESIATFFSSDPEGIVLSHIDTSQFYKV